MTASTSAQDLPYERAGQTPVGRKQVVPKFDVGTEVQGGFPQPWRTSTGSCWVFPLPAGSEEPEQPLGAVAFKKSSAGLPGWILPWEEAGGLWTGEKSAISEYVVARKLELPGDRPTLHCWDPSQLHPYSWAEQACLGTTVSTLCVQVESMRQARIRPKCFQNVIQEDHPPQPPHSSTEPWWNQFTTSFSVLMVPISLSAPALLPENWTSQPYSEGEWLFPALQAFTSNHLQLKSCGTELVIQEGHWLNRNSPEEQDPI